MFLTELGYGINTDCYSMPKKGYFVYFFGMFSKNLTKYYDRYSKYRNLITLTNVNF